MTLATILTAIKNKCGISGSAYDTYLTQEVNDAQRDFTRELNLPYLETKGSAAIVQYQYIYDLNNDFDTIQGVTYRQKHKLIPINYEQFLMLKQGTSFGIPRYYLVHEGKLKIHPNPNVAAPTTTLDGAIASTTAATITLADTSDLAQRGRGIIEDEVVDWQYVDSANEQIEICTRGVEGTTAATHDTANTFTYRELEYTYWKTLADLSGTNTPEIPARYHDALIIRPSASFLRDHAEELGKADRLMVEYRDIKNQAKADLGEKMSQRFSTTLEDTVARGGGLGDEFTPGDSSLTAA